MKFKTHCQYAKGPVDTAPMVDIVFLLLIFLVLSSPLVLQPGIGLELPASNTPAAASFQGLVVTVTRDNLLFFNNQVTTIPALRQFLQSEAAKTRRQELIIKADRNVAHGTVIQLMGIALEAGIPAVNLATRPEMPAQPSAK